MGRTSRSQTGSLPGQRGSARSQSTQSRKEQQTFRARQPPSTASYEVRQLTAQNRAFRQRTAFADEHQHSFQDTSIWTDVVTYDYKDGDCTEEMWQHNIEFAFHMWLLEGMRNDTVSYVECEFSGPEFDTDADGFIIHDAMFTLDGDEPTTVKEAKQRPDAKEYLESLQKELNGHYENGTGVPCELPPGVTPITSKIVWVRKVNPDGTIRYKARIVCRGK